MPAVDSAGRRRPFCHSCRREFEPVELLRGAERYDRNTGTIGTSTPCCGDEETVRIKFGVLERGYVYCAGAPHFSAEEEYRIDGLAWEETGEGLRIAFGQESRTLPRREPG